MDAYTLGTLLDDLVMAVVCARLAVVVARHLGHLGHLRRAGRLAVVRIPAARRRGAAEPGRTPATTGSGVQAA